MAALALLLLLQAPAQPLGSQQQQQQQQQRGIRWAVNYPAAVAPFLLGDNRAGWGNTSRSVAHATVGIVVIPVFGLNISGKLTTLMADKLHPNSLAAYADKVLEVIVDIAPSGINCSALTTQRAAEAKHCVMPDALIQAALARKEAFAQEVLQQLIAVRATGFAIDWEDSFGNNQTNAAALWGYTKNVISARGCVHLSVLTRTGAY
jgi:hypothetical protein